MSGAFQDDEEDTSPAAPQAMTPPPQDPRGFEAMQELRLHIRYAMKGLELVRLIVEAGYDADVELARLHEVYRRRRETGKIRLPVTELPPPPGDDPRREGDE